MPILAVLPLVTEVIRLINNIIEGKPMEQRRAEAIIAFNLLWPIAKPVMPADVAAAVEKLMSEIK